MSFAREWKNGLVLLTLCAATLAACSSNGGYRNSQPSSSGSMGESPSDMLPALPGGEMLPDMPGMPGYQPPSMPQMPSAPGYPGLPRY